MTDHTLHKGGTFTLECHESSAYGTTILKYPTAVIPSSGALNRLRREQELCASLDLTGVRRSFGTSERAGRSAIVLEYIPGQNFKTCFGPPEDRDLASVLGLILSAATALDSLHTAGIVHRDIAASNLLRDERSGAAVIIDLEFASLIGENKPVSALEGQLPYLAPELTGRLDLPVDQRSDLYSFGIVFYEALTGELPFRAEDAAGWVHAHLARLPEPPVARQPSLPQVVSDIVMRLLAKAPENRYQSARGLCHDLALCLDRLQADGSITPFALGHGDHSGQLRFAPELYGRADEQQRLKDAFEAVAAGQPRLVCVSGYAGSGKTTLVNELRFPVAAADGRFISGKFDQALRAFPYAAFAEAFTNFCHQMLAGTVDTLDGFRRRVLENLGDNAGLLLKIVPLLEQVIGPQPQPPELETAETSNRFAITLLGFFHCLVEVEHPLIIFLDDLQWADSASLELLDMIATRAVRDHFLIVCAYRDADLSTDHPLPALLDRLQATRLGIERISLAGLTPPEVASLTADALESTVEAVRPLVDLLHTKTDGNPFFLRQLLQSLVEEDVLEFDPRADTWRWDASQIQALDISDNVIELMLRKITRLPETVCEALHTAACIGNSFALELLKQGDEPLQAVRQRLAPAIDSGLVALLGNDAHFTHDRIQQVVYQSLKPAEAQRIHLRLGRQMIEQQNAHPSLAAVQQLNRGVALIEQNAEILRLAELNLYAGDSARGTMAYDMAREFYETGERLASVLDGVSAELLFELRFHRAETIFFLGDAASAVEQLEALIAHAPDTAASARIYQTLIDIHTVEIKLNRAMETGNRALAELGVVIPHETSPELLMEGVDEVERIVAELGDDITAWPEMQDQRELAIAGLLTHLLPAAFISASPQFPLISIEFARRVLVGGLSRFSSFAFSVFGMLLAVVLESYASANRIGRLAIEIARRPDGAALRARANFFHAVFVQHWSEALETTLPYLDEGWKAGLETGDLQFTSYCINNSHGHGLLASQSLIELEQSLDKFEEINRVIRQEDGQHYFAMLKQTVRALRHCRDELPDLIGEYGGSEVVEGWRGSGNASNLATYHLLRSLLGTVLRTPVAALEDAEQAASLMGGLRGTAWVPLHCFLHALTLAGALRDAVEDPAATLDRIRNYRDQLGGWAQQGVENYRAKLLLIEAELADLENQDRGALLDAYDSAIDIASTTGRTLELALACELAAGCWLRRGKQQLAGLYLQRALDTYLGWGADAKVERLKRTHAALLLPLHPRDDESSSTSSSSDNSSRSMEIYSVIKAAQTVAGELVLDRMLSRLIRLVIETAGAQSGFLLLQQDGEWCVVAAQQPEQSSVDVLQWLELDHYPAIAANVVRYVERTHKIVNLDEASKSTLFAGEQSSAWQHRKSLLCLPIVNRGELAGILYLENNLATHAFTRTHTRILQLLTTQAISSLEISRYYAQVQNLNSSLEEEIEERKRTESQLAYLANHDPLTDLPNRRLFYDRVKHAIQRSQRNGGRVALLYLDLDQFKNINDTLSHQVGDGLLQQLARRLSQEVRGDDTLGRLGGDEFVLLMEGDLNLRDLSVIAEKMLSACREPLEVEGHELHPSCSLGISLYPDDAADVDELLQNADAAMYQAKHSGRNTYRFFSAKLAAAAAVRLSLEQDLRKALEREEFELYYQPQVALQSGEITGAEVLLRWNHPQRGLVPPMDFIPVAEESGHIVAIGEWVLTRACEQLQQWSSQGIEIGSLGVNVSGNQFAPHGGFFELVKRTIDSTGIDPARLELELTESAILQDTAFTMRSMKDLNALGIRLAIDDFGTGYSSLSYLHRLPVHRLKIDRSFVSGLPDERDSATIVQSVMLLGQNLGKQMIAEGIENEAQRYFLQQLGCDEAQGYLFGKPMPLAAFEKLLRK